MKKDGPSLSKLIPFIGLTALGAPIPPLAPITPVAPVSAFC